MTTSSIIPSRRALLGAGVTLAVLGGPLASQPAVAQASKAASDAGDELANPGAAADAVLFPGFRRTRIAVAGITVDGTPTSGATINTLVGGKGPPLLLIHGHPETHVAWHKVAASLAERFTVVLTDLRGYGDSTKPDGGPGHVNYSKRAMGHDQVEVMKALGFPRFQAVGHDRGGRVLQFMMLDHPDAVTRGVVLDIAPTDLMYDQTNETFATRYFWWFFHVQPAPLPETMIGAMPDLYLRDHLDVQNKTPGAINPLAYAEYLRCYDDPACIHAVCEDYRAAATIDRKLVKEAGRKLSPPLLALWGAKGTVGQLFDVVGMWKREAETVTGHPLPCGHLIEEEDPRGLIDALQPFLQQA